MSENSLIFKKGSEEQKFLKKQVNSLIQLSGNKSLKSACENLEKDNSYYQLIYGQLNGNRICKLSDIEPFVKMIDKEKCIEMQNGKPVIVTERKQYHKIKA